MKHTRLAALVAVLTLAACGGEATAPASSQLTADEAEALAVAMSASGDAYANSVATPPVAAIGVASAIPFGPITYGTEQPCPLGGTIVPNFTVQGMLDTQAGSLTLDVTGSQTPKACAYAVKDLTITVNGNPNIGVTAHLSVTDGMPSGPQTFAQKGAFTWAASDGREGSCSIDVSASADLGANVRSVSGSFCGWTLSYSGPLE